MQSVVSLVNIGVLAEATESKVYLAGLLTEALNWSFLGDVADPVLPAAPGVEHHPAVLPRPAVLLPSKRASQFNLLPAAKQQPLPKQSIFDVAACRNQSRLPPAARLRWRARTCRSKQRAAAAPCRACGTRGRPPPSSARTRGARSPEGSAPAGAAKPRYQFPKLDGCDRRK